MVYEGYKVCGPYTRKDGRKHIILVKGGKKRTVSYPKYLVECFLGRYLLATESVDHIDMNFRNNSLTNLRVIDKVRHAQEDAVRVIPPNIPCTWCGRMFICLTPSKLFRKDKASSGFCSKKCVGEYGVYIQKGGKPLGKSEVTLTYTKLKDENNAVPLVDLELDD